MHRQLLQRTTGCSGQSLHETTVPNSKLLLGTASTKAVAFVNDRIFRQIAKLALDGTLSQSASNQGIFMPYDTGRLRQVVDAENRENLLGWALTATILILTLSVIQTRSVRRAKRAAETAQAEAKETQHRFDEFMKHTPAITFMKDEHGRVVYSNEVPSAGRIPISPQLSQNDEEVLAFGESVEITETLQDGDGADRHYLVLKFPFHNARGQQFLGGVALDVTARVLAKKDLEYQAESDLVTGLPNRRSFMTELDGAIEKSRLSADPLAVGFIDLDGFKRVNDAFGHAVGDELLKQVGARLRRFCRDSDMVARLGGDEFTFLLYGATPALAKQTMASALRSLEEPFPIDGRETLISASIGLSLFPDNGATSQSLVRNADLAMYSAKANGKGRIEFCSQAQSSTATLLRLSGELSRTPREQAVYNSPQ